MGDSESHAPQLRQALLALSDGDFEEFLEAALEEFTGRRFYRADSGAQDGGDGGADGPFRIIFEAKRYDRAQIKLDALLGKFVMATQRAPRPDLWILAGTRNVSDQRRRALQREADEKGVGLAILDMPRGRLGSLAALCASAPRTAEKFLPGARTALAVIHLDPFLDPARKRLRDKLDSVEVSFGALQAGMRTWLATALEDAGRSRTRLHLRLPTFTSSDPWAGYVPRESISKGFTTWRSTGDAVFCIAGEEGVGKTLGAFDLLRRQLDDCLVVVVGRTAEVLQDPLELMARVVGDALGGDPARWRRKLDFLLERPASAPRILLYLDGIDERPGAPWQPLLQRLDDDRFRGKVAVLISVRPSPFEDRLRGLNFLSAAPIVRPLDIFTPDELDVALGKRQLNRATFTAEMLELMRRPRLFDLALKHKDRLEAVGEFTAARLYWEDWEDRVARGRGIASASGFRNAIRRLARELDVRFVVAPPALLAAFEAASPLDPQPEPVRQSISELVDGGLAKLQGEHVRIEPRFAALALGYDLEQRLASTLAARPGVPVAEMADQVRAWLEPWGGADFDAEVVRTAAWARHLATDSPDVVMEALLLVWLDRKTVPLHHGQDLVALTRALPQRVLPGFHELLSGPDVAAASRAGEILAARAEIPALRPLLIAETHRWICEIGLTDYPFLGSNPDPEGYRKERLADVERLLETGVTFGTPLPVEGETVFLHDAARPDGVLAGKRALGLLRKGGADDLWPIIRAWAVTTSLRYHDDLDGSVAGILRSVEANSPLDALARGQLEAWSASESLAAMAAARSLSWALGDPAARRIAERALVRSGFVAKRTAELESSRGHFSPETLEEVREQVARQARRDLIRTCEDWTYDPEFALPEEVVADAAARATRLDPDGLLFATATTETSLEIEALTPVLARTAPTVLGDWMRRLAREAVQSNLAGGDIYRRYAISDLIVLGEAELETVEAAETLGRAADDLRIRAALARRDGDAQIAYLLEADLPPQLTIHLVDESRAPGPIGLARATAALDAVVEDEQRLGLLLFHLANVLPQVSDELASQLLSFMDHTSTVVRTYAFQLLSQGHAEPAARRLQALRWSVESAGSDQEAWWGSYLLCEGRAPLDHLQSAANPRHVLRACEHMADGGIDLFVGIVDDKLRRISGGGPVPDRDARIDRLASALEGHETRLGSTNARRADWRQSPRNLAELWRANPGAFNQVASRLTGLDDIELGDAVHACPGFVLALMEAGLAAAPERLAPVWRRLPRVISDGVRYGAEFSTDWVRTMPFGVQSAPFDLLDEALELARSDVALLDVVLLAEHEGHTAWLEGAIERDLRSPTTWRRARGLMIQGLSGRVPAALDAFPRLDARASWLSSVMAIAETHRRRRFRLDHWFDCFKRSDAPDDVFSTFELVKGAATRWVYVRMRRDELTDLQRRHVRRQEAELKRAIEKAEKKMSETFLGTKALLGIWPAPQDNETSGPHDGL